MVAYLLLPMKSSIFTNREYTGYVPYRHTEKYQYHRLMSRSFIQREAYDSTSPYMCECEKSGKLYTTDRPTRDHTTLKQWEIADAFRRQP
jgi:hypothetical protein